MNEFIKLSLSPFFFLSFLLSSFQQILSEHRKSSGARVQDRQDGSDLCLHGSYLLGVRGKPDHYTDNGKKCFTESRG